MSLRFRSALPQLAVGLVAASQLLIAGCNDSTAPAPTATDSFQLTAVDNAALPAPLWSVLGGSIQLNSATLKPKEPGKLMDVREFLEVFPGGTQTSRDSTVVELEISGSQWIIHRPHPNPALAHTDTGTVSNGLLTLPTTLDYRATRGVSLKRVTLLYRVID